MSWRRKKEGLSGSDPLSFIDVPRVLLGWYSVHQKTETLYSTVLLSILSDESIRRMSLLAMSKLSYVNQDWSRKGLFDWERGFIEGYLPERGRILVGGCGGGREIMELLRRGYEVVGFDPVVEGLSTCRKMALEEGFDVTLFSGGYEDLKPGRSSGQESRHEFERLKPSRIEDLGPYSAVVLGWTSLTHVVSKVDRENLFSFIARDSVCPDGPVLSSFWYKSDVEGSARLLVRARERLLSISGRDLKDRLHRGLYGHFFSRRELEDLASAAGFRILAAGFGESGEKTISFPWVIMGSGEA